MGLSGKSGIVTGAASGIGRSVARHLAAQGVGIALLDTNGAGAAEAAEEIRQAGGRAVPLTVDVSARDQVDAAVAAAREALGPLQILVNVAGISEFTPFLQISTELWQRMLAVHLNGTFFCTQAVLPDMIQAGWGRVINTASVAGLNGGGPALAHYAAAKGGILALTKALAHEFGPAGVTVNAVAPGLIDTPLVRQTSIGESLIERMKKSLPVRRVGSVDDVAAACVYLASEEASFVTGQVLSPNGGAYL